MSRPRRVLLVGDDELALGGLARLLDSTEGWVVASSVEDEPDAVLLDLKERGDRSLTELASRYPVVVLVSVAAWARDALARGARGAVLRSSSGPKLARALEAVLEGLVVLDEDISSEALRPPTSGLGGDEALTPRELEVLEWLALGLSNREIAERLSVSFHTVKFHVNSILGKLGASSRTEVVALAARAGLLRF